MKILHIIDYFQPQLGYQETYLAKSQIEKGYDVQVITSDRYSPILFKGGASEQLLGKRRKGSGRFIEEGIDVVRLDARFEFLGNLWLNGLERSIINSMPDVIHKHGISSITSIRVAALKRKLKKTKIIFDDHMTFNAMRGVRVRPLYKFFNIFFSNHILKNSNAIVAVTNETKDFINKMYGIPLNKISVIPLGCDATKFQRDHEYRAIFRQKYGMAQGETVFCYAGKIIEDKGVDLLLDAAIELLKSKEKIKVLCVGGKDDTYFKYLEKKIMECGFKDKFIFIPAVPNKDLYKFYSMADVGIWPKQCSLTMIEAMACKLPVIISSTSGSTERVIENSTGYFYKEGSIDDLKNKMKLFLNESKLDEMGANARKSADRYDWKIISKSFEELYFQ